MSTEIATNPQEAEQKAIIEAKRTNWANLGEKIHHNELHLQAQAQNQIVKMTLPTCIEQVTAAEQGLKEMKQAQNSIIVQRKEMTAPFDKVTSRLMEAEKSLNEPIEQLTNAIIQVKRDYEIREKAKQAKIEENKKIIETVKTFLANTDQAYRSKISAQCTSAYQFALNNDENPLTIDAFIAKCSAKLGVTDFEAMPPQLPFVKFHDVTEISVIMDEIFLCNPHAYVKIYQDQLSEKFADYAVAFNNKVQALEANKKEDERKQAELLQQKENSQLAAKLESTAVDFMVQPATVRSLKKSFEVDMPETMENAIRIWQAFVANVELCMPKMRSQKPFAITPAMLAGHLAKVKNDDANFQPQGITFKEVEKL